MTPCENCDGSGVVDSGGVTPWGAAIDIPCPFCASKPTTRADTENKQHTTESAVSAALEKAKQ